MLESSIYLTAQERLTEPIRVHDVKALALALSRIFSPLTVALITPVVVPITTLAQ